LVGVILLVAGQAGQVDDRVLAGRGGRQGRRVADVVAVGQVEAGHLVPRRLKLGPDDGAEHAPVAGHEYPHRYSCAPKARSTPKKRLYRSSPPRTRRRPRTPSPPSLSMTVPVIALPWVREATSTNAAVWSSGSE